MLLQVYLLDIYINLLSNLFCFTYYYYIICCRSKWKKTEKEQVMGTFSIPIWIEKQRPFFVFVFDFFLSRKAGHRPERKLTTAFSFAHTFSLFTHILSLNALVTIPVLVTQLSRVSYLILKSWFFLSLSRNFLFLDDHSQPNLR